MKSLDPTEHDDPFLIELESSEAQTACDALGPMSAGLGTVSAPTALRDRVLKDLYPYERFARFEAAVAGLLCVSNDAAAAALKRIDDESAWQEQAPGIAILPVPAGASAGYVFSGFLRVQAGTVFPQHEHLGEELTLVLQGAFDDDSSGRRYGPGEPARLPAGSRHGFLVPKDGPHLVGLVTLHTGFRLL